ncbi:unnamed protein product [Rotaria socialis]|uniref:Uncharacterized protein n=1 Tax=Rotaria socialis TaxID=392032 RepID=A0A817TB47_9BILA|nr:unnamed protein product [Rotaria socialis]
MLYLIYSFVALTRLIVRIYAEMCHGMAQYGRCSTNSQCGCLHRLTTNHSGICGLIGLTCSQLVSCAASNNICYQPNHICVHHPRCNTRPLCYPLSMTDERLCPARPRPGDGICEHATWSRMGITVAGGNGVGDGLNQLDQPFGIFVNENQTVYVADFANHRIVKWDRNASTGQLVAGGNGQGGHSNQLYYPSDVTVEQDGTMYISDGYNFRVQKWARDAQSGETVIGKISVHDIAQDDQGTLYVSIPERGEISRWLPNAIVGEVMILNFSRPLDLVVDRNRLVYVADNANQRILKVNFEKREVSVVAGGSHGNGTDQLSSPNGVAVDQLGTVYVADTDNRRVVRWPRGATSGSIIAGGRGPGSEPDQFDDPTDLSFDLEGNLYVVDPSNHRVQRFAIDKSLC